MAEVKFILFGALTLVALFSFGLGLFTWAITEGDYSTPYPRSFTQAEAYLNKTNAITGSLANQTAKVGETPASTDPTLTYGTILTVALQIITIPVDAVNLMVNMLFDLVATPAVGGYIPGWFVAIAIIWLTLLMILGILAMALKWLS